MPSIGIQELAIILVIILVIFGAGKLPDVMRDLGAGVREMRATAQELEELEKERGA